MKKTITILSLIAALSAIVIVSCKKDDNKQIEEPQTREAAVQQFTIPEDIDGYLTSFKKDLLTAGNSNNSMGVEEAAWHLAALANYDFGHFNALHTNILMDTLYSHVKISNGQLAFRDLADAYADIHETIDKYFQKLDVVNKQIHFVNAFIGEDGEIVLPVAVTYSDRYVYPYHDWYIDDTTYCQDYFEGHGPFQNFGNGMALLEYLLNLIDSYNTDPDVGSTYAVPHGTIQPLPNNQLDSYGTSPNFINSRIYCTNETTHSIISESDMCYYLQSYHELGDSFLYNVNTGDVVAYWSIAKGILNGNPYQMLPESINYQQTYYHKLTITYGLVATHGGNDPIY